MRRFFPASELARDERFNTVTMRERDRTTAAAGADGPAGAERSRPFVQPPHPEPQGRLATRPAP